MIYLICKRSSPRLEYIADIVFTLILNTEYRLAGEAPPKLSEDDICLYYSSSRVEGLSIPDEGLLFEDSIRSLQPIIDTYSSVPCIKFSGQDFSDHSIPFDLLSAAFFIISEYELDMQTAFDEHGRYIEKQSFIYKHQLYRTPLLHVYAEYLWQKLIAHNPRLKREERQFDYTLTFDIDSPYLYLYKPLLIQAGGFLKDILKGNWQSASNRIRTLASGQDPYDVYELINRLAPKEKLIFFFLVDRKHAHDERHTYRNKPYRELIRRIQQKGIQTGIHPSYTAYRNAERINFETGQLQDITGQPVHSSRMHFLKYHLPETFRYLIQAGITDDYTLCPAHYAGFKTGMCISYPFYDLQADEQTSLQLHPTMVMDRALQKYMSLDKDLCLEEMKQLADTCRQYNGQFIILLHNNTLSETAEWKGWRNTFEKAIEYLK